jgi:hypothetical protein
LRVLLAMALSETALASDTTSSPSESVRPSTAIAAFDCARSGRHAVTVTLTATESDISIMPGTWNMSLPYVMDEGGLAVDVRAFTPGLFGPGVVLPLRSGESARMRIRLPPIRDANQIAAVRCLAGYQAAGSTTDSCYRGALSWWKASAVQVVIDVVHTETVEFRASTRRGGRGGSFRPSLREEVARFQDDRFGGLLCSEELVVLPVLDRCCGL